MSPELIVIIAIVLVLNMNALVGVAVSSYIKKTRGSDLGFKDMHFIKRYFAYHSLALLFYAMSSLYFLTGKRFHEVF